MFFLPDEDPPFISIYTYSDQWYSIYSTCQILPMLFQSEGTHSIWCCQLGIQAPILYVYHADRNLCSTKLMAKSQFDEPEEEASGWGNRLVAVRGMSSRYFSRYPMAMFLVASTPSFILAQHIYHIYISHISYIYYVICNIYIYIYHTYHIYIYVIYIYVYIYLMYGPLVCWFNHPSESTRL